MDMVKQADSQQCTEKYICLESRGTQVSECPGHDGQNALSRLHNTIAVCGSTEHQETCRQLHAALTLSVSKATEIV